jgi:hypothetical protein
VERCELHLRSALDHYAKIAREDLGVGCPIIIEAGIGNSQGLQLYLNHQWISDHTVQQANIASRQRLNSFDQEEVRKVLLAIFEDFFDAAYEERPLNYGQFPS